MSKIFSFHILTILVGFCIMMTKGEEETHPLQKSKKKVRKKEEKVRKKEEKRKVLPMISTGIIRSIDNLGRIVLPKELRSSYGITPETPLEIMTEGEMILLRKYQPADACIFCNEVKPGTVMLHGKRICPTCRRELEKL